VSRAGLARLEQSLTIALDHNLQEHAGRAYANLASIAVRHYESGLALRYVSEGLEYCEVHEVHDCLSYIRAYSAHYELNAGEWDKAARVASELLEVADAGDAARSGADRAGSGSSAARRSGR